MEINKSLTARYYGSRDNCEPKMIVVHYTAGSEKGDIRVLSGQTGRKVSSHYYITKKGKIFQFVDERLTAFHAGSSKWKGYEKFEWPGYSVNKVSIGVELENSGYELYPEAQIEALSELVKDIRTRWTIAEDDIVGHCHVSPQRKIDPGAHFPWSEFKQKVFGVKENYPDWAKSGVKFCKDKGLITKITGEPIPDYRLAVILERFYKEVRKPVRRRVTKKAKK